MSINFLTGQSIDGNLSVLGGSITLGGTGRIQGIDTVSASTDAVNKAYVDAMSVGILTLASANGITVTGGTTANATVGVNYTAASNNLVHPATTITELAQGTSYGTYFLCANSNPGITYGAVSKIRTGHMRLNDFGAPDGSVSMNSQKIIDVATPTGTTDAANKAYVDAHGGGLGPFLPLAGGTLTGNTNLTGSTKKLILSSGAQLGFEDAVPTGTIYLYNDGAATSRLNIGGTMWVEEAGNVGIGVTGPSSKLHVGDGDIQLDDGYEILWDNSGLITAGEELVLATGGTDSKIILDGADSGMRFITGNSTAIAIDDSQNVGIGTTSPAARLHVRETANSTSAGYVLLVQSVNGGGDYFNTSGFYKDSSQNMQLKLTANSGSNSVFINSAGDSYLNGGDIGIGTTSPDAKLEVSSSSGGVLRLTSSDTSVATGESIGRVEFKSNDASTGGNNVMGFVDCLATNAGSTYALTFGTGNAFAAVERMRIDNLGNVGIGTTSPDAKLEVVGTTGVIIDSGSNSGALLTLKGDASSFGGGAQINIIGGSQDYLYYATNIKRSPGTLEAIEKYEMYGHKWTWDGNMGSTAAQPYTSYDFKSQGSSQMVIYNNNVGIGTTGPGYKLDVSGTGRFTDVLYASKYIRIEEAGTTANIANGLGYNQGTDDFAYTGNDSIVRYLNHYGIGIHRPIGASITGGRGFYMGGYFGIDFFTAGLNRFHIAQGGYVGIGTTSPNTTLEVDGAISTTTSDYVQGTTGSRLLLETSGSGNTHSYIQAQNSGGSSNAEDLALQLYGGEVGIGTDNPYGKLDVAGNIRLQSDNQIYFGATGSIPYWNVGVENTTNNNFEIAGVSYYGGDRDILLTPVNNGNVGIKNTAPSYTLDVTGNGRYTSTVTATNFILSSDKRLKDNIKEIDTNHVDVNWKNFELKSEPGVKRAGVIAQELEEKHPEFVRTDDEGMKSVAYIDLLIAKIAELEARLEKAGL